MNRLGDNVFRFVVSRFVWAGMLAVGLAMAMNVTLAVTGVAHAQDGFEDDDVAIESAGDALGGWSAYPWYDSQKDDLRPINVKPPTPSSTSNSWLGKLMADLLGALMWFLGWIVIPAVCVVILYFLVRSYFDSEHRHAAIPDEEVEEYDIARIEALPAKIRTATGDLLSEARRYYKLGDYRQAIIYLYSHQLLQLDNKQLIRLTKGKTNRQYVREIASRRSIKELLEPTMFAFEDVFFGGHTLTQSAFETCWQRQVPFDEQLKGQLQGATT